MRRGDRLGDRKESRQIDAAVADEVSTVQNIKSVQETRHCLMCQVIDRMRDLVDRFEVDSHRGQNFGHSQNRVGHRLAGACGVFLGLSYQFPRSIHVARRRRSLGSFDGLRCLDQLAADGERIHRRPNSQSDRENQRDR